MKITMKEVAKLAGVGVGTVSRVLNNGSVKESTRLKVEAAMKELNYQPDLYARSFKTNRTNTIALIIPTVWHPFFSEFAWHVEHQLEKNNYKVYLCNSSGNADKEQEYIQMVVQNKVDGIIGITYSDIDQYISSNLPFVSIDRYFTEDVIYVTADNSAGGRLAVDELRARGCQKLAYIGGYQETPNETKNRRKYFEIECQRLKQSYEILDMLEPLTDLADRLSEFLTARPDIDGIFTINDSMALDVQRVLTKLGRRVPEDVQIIGFDGQRNREGEKYLVSSIAQPVELMGKTAVDLILQVINGQDVQQRTVLPVAFVEGGTTQSKE
ncbi:LacI family DNA-binding transcriptional regulator [Enterococcus sp. LJL120]